MSYVTCSTSFDDISDEWSSFLSRCVINTPFQTPQWQRAWIRELGNCDSLSLLRFVDNGQVLGMVSLRASDGRITFVGDEDVCDYNDFLVPKGKEIPFYQAFIEYLDQQEWNTLRLYSLVQNSPTLAHLPHLARSRGYEVEISQEEVCPGKALPETWDVYLASLNKKDRHELRRKLRRLDSVEEVSWYGLTHLDDVERGMDDFLGLLKISKEDKYHFLTPQRERFFRAIASELGEMGLLRLYFMEIEGKRVASALTLDYGSSRMLYNSGYNPEYGYYSVGLLLNALVLKSAIDAGKAYFDFLRGDEPYKYHLGGEDRLVYTMVVTKR